MRQIKNVVFDFGGVIIDMNTIWNMPAVNVSFILPFICFVVITIYGHRSYQRGKY